MERIISMIVTCCMVSVAAVSPVSTAVAANPPWAASRMSYISVYLLGSGGGINQLLSCMADLQRCGKSFVGQCERGGLR